jgi:hypothetical protein
MGVLPYGRWRALWLLNDVLVYDPMLYTWRPHARAEPAGDYATLLMLRRTSATCSASPTRW